VYARKQEYDLKYGQQLQSHNLKILKHGIRH